MKTEKEESIASDLSTGIMYRLDTRKLRSSYSGYLEQCKQSNYTYMW